jgi:putative DNA primase/helicase
MSVAAQRLTLDLGGRWHGSYGEARCPAHEDRRPSLSIRSGEKSVLLKCHAGCSTAAIIAALRRKGLWDAVSETPRRRGSNERSSEDKRRYALSIWRECRPIVGTPAEHYLRSRGIRGELPPSLRYHPGLKHSYTGRLLPCMVAAVQAADRSIVGLHRTFLRADGADKAPVSHPRMMVGTITHGAVRLAASGSELAIGEGVETSLSFQEWQRVPTWAALSASGLQTVVLPPRPLAATVFVLVDLDEAGETAGRLAADRLSREGRIVKLARPMAGKDFNDAVREAQNAP